MVFQLISQADVARIADSIDINEKWVSDGLTHCLQDWPRGYPVFINAPTGSGKNTFIWDKLIPFANSICENVLIISNRLALNIQQKRNFISHLYNSNANLVMGNDELKSQNDFAYNSIKISIMNYQNILGYIESLKYPNNPALANAMEYSYVIMDEAHYFVSDSLFNSSTYKTLTGIIDFFWYATRIYLSATPDEVLPQIAYEESMRAGKYVNPSYGNRLTYCSTNKVYSIPKEKPMVVYNFQWDFSGYNWLFFEDMVNIIESIEDSSPDEKWLIFVSSREEGQSIARDLNKRNKNSAKYIDARNRDESDDENSSVWALLTTESRFDCQVLISTSVLDNGIDIKDDSLKHVVITTCDKVEMLQMLGRKRRVDNETVNVYIRDVNNIDLSNYIKSNERAIEIIDEFGKNPSDSLLYSYWNKRLKGDFDIRNYFYLNTYYPQMPMMLLELNWFARVKLECRRNQYGEIKAKKQEKHRDGFPSLVMEWIGHSDAPINWVGTGKRDAALRELTEYVENRVGRSFTIEGESATGEKWEEFCNKYHELLKKSLPRSVLTEKQWHKLPESKSPKAMVNNSMDYLGIPYEVTNKRPFTLVKKEVSPIKDTTFIT